MNCVNSVKREFKTYAQLPQQSRRMVLQGEGVPKPTTFSLPKNLVTALLSWVGGPPKGKYGSSLEQCPYSSVHEMLTKLYPLVTASQGQRVPS